MKIKVKHLYLALALLATSFCMPGCDDDGEQGGSAPSSAKAVDLGLSVKWAPWNVGATSAGEAGAYFAWGEITAKSEYEWSTYKWTEDGGDTFTKYTTDGKTTLDSEDDAATANWGGKWRMPTLAELQELSDNCTWT